MKEAHGKVHPKSQNVLILALTPAQQEDEAFIFDTFKAAMKDYVQWAWGWDEDAQRKGLLNQKNLAGFQIISLFGERVGALLLERSDELHYLRTIFILPKYHKRGIGGLVMQSLQQNAQADSKTLHLRVIATNPAQRLYARLGFKVIEQDAKTLLMRWHAPVGNLVQ
jgi:GNAT superfamily N-acetyltransferase